MALTPAQIDTLLAQGARTAERVVSVTSDHPAVAAQATSVDATTRLGTCTLTIDRSRYPTSSTSSTSTTPHQDASCFKPNLGK